jgi:hypothetical protein
MMPDGFGPEPEIALPPRLERECPDPVCWACSSAISLRDARREMVHAMNSLKFVIQSVDPQRWAEQRVKDAYVSLLTARAFLVTMEDHLRAAEEDLFGEGDDGEEEGWGDYEEAPLPSAPSPN